VDLGGLSVTSKVGIILNISISFFKKQLLFHWVIPVIFGNNFLNITLIVCIHPIFISSMRNDVNIR
jgi:hypothetical protein